jgi:hypothetical protein
MRKQKESHELKKTEICEYFGGHSSLGGIVVGNHYAKKELSFLLSYGKPDGNPTPTFLN